MKKKIVMSQEGLLKQSSEIIYKKLFMITYGCQMNVYDSNQMQNIMLNQGYILSNDIQDADLIIMNTCNIREKAAEKVYSELGKIRKYKENRIKNNQQMVIVIAGCVGQAEGEEIFKRAPFVDIVVGPQSYQTLPSLINKIGQDYEKLINLEFANENKFDSLPEENFNQNVSSYLTIQEGCDQFCLFCSVPYTRGAEYSRPVSQIYREALKSISSGSKEIVLLGQNVNAYHGEEGSKIFSLTDLIKHLAKIDSLERIRYTTSHPIDMSDELINIHGTESKLMPFLHLPVQSGSNKILKAMNRKHNRDFYIKIINDLRNIRSDIGFSSDFIVGFPGETEEDFQDTLDLIKTVNYAQCYSFKYSKRPGTPATLMEEQIPEETKTRRLSEIQALLTQQQIEYNLSFIGKELEVLVEKIIEERQQVMGKSPYMQNVYVKGNKNLYGKIIKVKIVSANKTNLQAEIL